MTQLTHFLKQAVDKPEIYPIIAVLGTAFSGIIFMSLHQAHAPDVVWNHKTNEQPWHQVKEGDQIKLAAYNQKYERRFHRKEW
jgi:NADH dehydrogenase (ubiquinone) 1 alpha subcomplex subunit 4